MGSAFDPGGVALSVGAAGDVVAVRGAYPHRLPGHGLAGGQVQHLEAAAEPLAGLIQRFVLVARPVCR